MRFSLATVLLLVALAAGIVAAVKAFWSPQTPNFPFLFAVYCAIIGYCVAVAVFGENTARPTATAIAVFGVLFFAYVFRGREGIWGYNDLELGVEKLKLGFAMLGLTGLATYLGASIFRKPEK